MKNQKQTYWSIGDYEECLNLTIDLSRLLLLKFTENSSSIKDQIIYHFIAKSAGLIESILILWKNKHYSECWILYRALIDRLIHLWYLNKNEEFELYHKWTFIQKVEANNRAKSDTLFNKKLDSEYFDLSEADRKKYEKLKKEDISWKRPKAEDVSKKEGLSFIYKYGYDFASTKVHPMADEGMQDLSRLIELNLDNMKFADNKIILNNTLAIYAVILEDSLNISDLKWVKIIYDYIKEIMNFLKSNSKRYKETHSKLYFYLERNEITFCK